MVWSIRSRISSLLCSKAPLVGSYVYDSCWCLCFSAPTSSSIARPWPNFMDWVQMDRCRAAASLPLIKEVEVPDITFINFVEPSRVNLCFGKKTLGYAPLTY
ncbi:hypothetical protein HKD37_14G041004 [Glycine soja]